MAAAARLLCAGLALGAVLWLAACEKPQVPKDAPTPAPSIQAG
jgi:hypothetical protein